MLLLLVPGTGMGAGSGIIEGSPRARAYGQFWRNARCWLIGLGV